MTRRHNEQPPADRTELITSFVALYRRRHAVGILVGALLAALPVWMVSGLFHPGEAHWLVVAVGILAMGVCVAGLNGTSNGPPPGLDLCYSVVLALPLVAIALGLFVAGKVLTAEAIARRYQRLCVAAGLEESAMAESNESDGAPVGMAQAKLDRRWVIALVVILVAVVGGWRWTMEQGAHVNAGLIKLDAAQEFPKPQENALVRAAGRGDAGEIEKLARQGVDVNAVGAYRRVSPLIWAVLARKPESVRVLLDLGADPNFRVPTAPGMEPRPRSDEETNDMVGESPISEAIRRNDYPILELLLEHGGNPNIEGQGPPAVFVMTQPPDKRVNPMLQLMIEHGLNVNIRENETSNLLGSMITTGQFETAILLIERGADVHLLDRKVSVPCTRYPKKVQLDDDELVVNYGAVQLQRVTGLDGAGGDEVSRKLRAMFVDRGVKIPFWDPDTIRKLEVPSLAELRAKGTPDEVIQKIIRINKAAEVEEFGADLKEAIAKRYTYGHELEIEYAQEKRARK